MEKNLINKRFIDAVVHIIKTERKTNKSAIAAELGISNSKFSEILKERMNVGVDTIARLCKVYNINPSWLLFGAGEIVQPSDALSQKIIVYNQNDLRSLDYKDMEHYPNKQFIHITDFDACDFALKVSSDNLIPAICPCDIVLCKFLSKNIVVQFGKPHVIATKQGILICQIQSFTNDVYTITFVNQMYGSILIPKNEVFGIAVVVGNLHKL